MIEECTGDGEMLEDNNFSFTVMHKMPCFNLIYYHGVAPARKGHLF